MAIPEAVALQICSEIRQEYRGKWYTLAGMQCMGCTTASKGDAKKMCVSNAAGSRGCNLVRKCYDQQAKTKLKCL